MKQIAQDREERLEIFSVSLGKQHVSIRQSDTYYGYYDLFLNDKLVLIHNEKVCMAYVADFVLKR